MPTTIQLTEKTKTRLDSLKQYPRETYDDVVNWLAELAEEDAREFSTETKEGIKRGRDDVKKGRVYTTKQLLQELAI